MPSAWRFWCTSVVVDRWLQQLGYERAGDALHRSDKRVDPQHSYARELEASLDRHGDIQADAVIDVANVPTVALISRTRVRNEHDLKRVRSALWNQNLVSIVLVVDGATMVPWPVQDGDAGASVTLASAASNSYYSLSDVASGDVYQRHTNWFRQSGRVDERLLNNLAAAVSKLQSYGLQREPAQRLVGQCLFVSYLEHREIVGRAYREARRVEPLHGLIQRNDGRALDRLFVQLKSDFNGDMLSSIEASNAKWSSLPIEAFTTLDDFLADTDIEGGQQSFWTYDFRHIPVELLSGIYEKFLGDEKRKDGAFYTPRHLAQLTVDYAFDGVTHPDREVVYDGACGSGILLVSAFRRMLSAAEAVQGRQYDFPERCEFLRTHVMGSDISEAACRVTAFSLYLALLENLTPPDIARLAHEHSLKLPPLINRNILSGPEHGNFFTEKRRPLQPTIFISNPPWSEPDAASVTLYESWTKVRKLRVPRRQIANAFAYKAADDVGAGGRVALILPVGAMISSQSQDFLVDWMTRFRIEKIINLADLRHILFPGAIHPCAIVIGRSRDSRTDKEARAREMIEYAAPKADVQYAFRRFAIHASDRHFLPASRIADDNEMLRVFTWGSSADMALLSRLRMRGRISDIAGWWIGKGIHQSDKHVKTEKLIAVGKLAKGKLLRTTSLKHVTTPLLDEVVLEPWPSEVTKVPWLMGDEGRAYEARPRVLFPDGADTQRFTPRSVYADRQFAFFHTLGAIVGDEKDTDLLLFLSAYLRSALVGYQLLHTCYSLASERTRISTKEVEALAFFRPQQHANPKRAAIIVKTVADLLRDLGNTPTAVRDGTYELRRAEIDKAVCEYFSTSEDEQLLIDAATSLYIPSVQPASYESLYTACMGRPLFDEVVTYATALSRRLNAWKDAAGGQGHVAVEAMVQEHEETGGLGMLRISVRAKASSALISPANGADVVAAIDKAGALHVGAADLHVSSDFIVRVGDDLILIKPMLRRFWHPGRALGDARRLLELVAERVI
jgi:hypothetical protein